MVIRLVSATLEQYVKILKILALKGSLAGGNIAEKLTWHSEIQKGLSFLTNQGLVECKVGNQENIYLFTLTLPAKTFLTTAKAAALLTTSFVRYV